jgi:hypothetical protein
VVVVTPPTPVRAKRGRRVHAVAGAGDGPAACGRVARDGWRVAFDKIPDCKGCLLALARRHGTCTSEIGASR